MQFVPLIPEVVVLLAAVTALFARLLPGGERGVAVVAAAATAAAGVAAVVIGPSEEAILGGAMEIGPVAVFVRASVALLAAAYLLWLGVKGMGPMRPQEAVALALFSTLGGMFLVSARDLVVLYMSLELSTMPAYVLMGYARRDELSLEGTLKFFLLSMLTSLVFVYGLSFVYGFSGSTAYSQISLVGTGPLGPLAALFVAVGFLAKVSAAPFHYWAPDAYAGAPASAVAFVSSVPKIAAFAAMAELLVALSADAPGLASAIALVAAVSMVLGNLAAYPQRDMRRLMAYSAVGHAGYLLLGVASGVQPGMAASVFYAAAYAAPSMAIMLVADQEGSRVEDFAGLASRRPWLAWATTAFLLSLIGIPPLAGFFGKLYLFTAALGSGLAWLVVLAVVASVVSAGYYFRVVRAMYFEEGAAEKADIATSRMSDAAIVFCLLVTLALGVAASPVLGMIGLAFD